MTYPPAYPPPQGYSGPPSPQYPPQAAYGSPPVSAPQGGATYGQPPRPAGHGAYMPPAQSAIPTQSVMRPPGAPTFPGQPYPPPSVQASAPQYQPYQSHQQQFQQFQHGAGSRTGFEYLSGAVSAPGYAASARPPQAAGLHPGAASSQASGALQHMPWRGLKAAALVMMIVGCALEVVVYVTYFLSLMRGNIWVSLIIVTLLFIATSPVIWWHYFGLRHLLRDQPVTEIIGLSLWFGYGVVTTPIAIPNENPYAGVQDITEVLLFIVTAVGATLTTRLNQRLRNPQPWPITLAVGACQFVLINSAVRLSYFGISVYLHLSTGKRLDRLTTNAWFISSDSGGAGLPLAAGLLILTIVTSLAVAGLLLGVRRPSSLSFRIASTSAVSLLTLYNIVIVLIYGLPTTGEYAFDPSSTGIAVAIVITHGAFLIGSTLAVRRGSAATPPAGDNQSHYGVASTFRPHGVQSPVRQYHQPGSPPWTSGRREYRGDREKTYH